jgi:hypothetical protein
MSTVVETIHMLDIDRQSAGRRLDEYWELQKTMPSDCAHEVIAVIDQFRVLERTMAKALAKLRTELKNPERWMT